MALALEDTRTGCCLTVHYRKHKFPIQKVGKLLVGENFIEVNNEYRLHGNKDVKSKLGAGTANTHV